MSVHEDTLQGLQEALDYAKGDKTKGRSTLVTLQEDDISMKFNLLPEESQKAILVIIDSLLLANNKAI